MRVSVVSMPKYALIVKILILTLTALDMPSAIVTGATGQSYIVYIYTSNFY